MAVATPKPDVSVIILTHNARQLIADCLGSVIASQQAGQGIEIIVVDNGSSDGTATLVAREWPVVRVLRNRTNAGVGRGRNQGLRASRADAVLFLDQDARLTPGCLDRLRAQLAADERAAAVGPRLIYGDGRWQRWTAGQDLTLASALSYLLFLDRLLPALPGFYLHRDVRTAFQPAWVSGACLLLRRAAVNQVNGFFEGGMNYMDDVDLCHRLRAGGWHIWYAPQAHAIHLMAGSPARRSARGPLRDFNRYFASRYGRLACRLLAAIEMLGFSMRTAVYLAAAVASRQPRHWTMARTHWTAVKVAFEGVA